MKRKAVLSQMWQCCCDERKAKRRTKERKNQRKCHISKNKIQTGMVQNEPLNSLQSGICDCLILGNHPTHTRDESSDRKKYDLSIRIIECRWGQNHREAADLA